MGLIMRWLRGRFRQAPARTNGLAAAQHAGQQSDDLLARVRSQQPQVDKLTAQARRYRDQDVFAALVTDAMRRRPQ